MGAERFESMYLGQAPWDIPGPQPALVRLEKSGAVVGSVLDAGCGTGENALYLASRGHEDWGIDYVSVAVERAVQKAHERGLGVHFQVTDALHLGTLARQFDTVINSGLFHTFGDEERPLDVAGLAQVVRPGGQFHMLCFSDLEPPGEGPRRVTRGEILDAFRDGWQVKAIRESAFETVDGPGQPRFSPGGPKAWLATVLRSVEQG